MFGRLSGALVAASIIPYAIQTYRRKITPNPTTWFLWTVIGGAIWLTYGSSGAGANVWPARFGFTNPLLILLLLLRDKWQPLDRMERWCLAISLTSLAMWLLVRNRPEYVQFALYLAIVADTIAATPQIKMVWKDPLADRPAAWAIFGIGYVLAFFAITEYTVANLSLPIYMTLGSFAIATPLMAYRLRTGVPVREWV